MVPKQVFDQVAQPRGLVASGQPHARLTGCPLGGFIRSTATSMEGRFVLSVGIRFHFVNVGISSTECVVVSR